MPMRESSGSHPAADVNLAFSPDRVGAVVCATRSGLVSTLEGAEVPKAA